jgi:magnesium transporter
VSYVPVWRAATRALAELGCAAFFIGGVAWTSLGAVGPWAVLAVVLFSVLIRAADIEARALFIPGGLPGSVRETLGQRLAIVSASALLVDRLMLGAIAAVVAGHYLVAFGQAVVGVTTPALVGDSGPMTIALLLIGIVWWLLREGRAVREDAVARAVAASVGVLVLLVLIGTVSALLSPVGSIPLHAPPVEVLSVATALGLVLSALGSVESLTQAAVDLEQPRIRNLQRVARLVSGYGILITAGLAFLFVAVVADGRVWSTAPLAGIAYQLAAPLWLRLVLVSLVVAAATAFLTATLRSTSRGAHGVLARLADDGVLDDGWRALHHRFGTPWRSIDTVFIAQVAIVMISGGETSWLARAYAIAAVIAALLKLVALVRYRSMRTGTRAYRVPLNLKVGGREWPLGLIGAAALLAIAAGALLAAADPPSLAGLLCVAAVTAALLVSERSVAGQPVGPRAVVEDFQLLPADVVDLRQVDVRPGNFLVPVRRPHILAHLVGAIRDAGDRDVVAMTVRLVGVDVPDDPSQDPHATEEEQALFSTVIAAAEREGRAVRLMIVPGVNVFDSIVETALRLESAEIHVGESETLSADDQARRLGEAWERASKPSAVDVRLVVHHPRGSTAAYHLGAHAPALRPEDFEHIHRLWLDVVRAVGPSVHHHDVVRAALIHMEHELNGPNRDAALQVVRDTVRPADEIASIIRERDFARLRDVLRNRPASDVASVLANLSLDERVLVFRILPRKTAAETFAYLDPEEQNALLRAMASEEAAALLNNMAPDDRTTFLEELPAEATRQLLSLLTPEERAEAVQLLGYPEGSIGRLMTPQYVSVKEDWTVTQVLDHIRTHGQDSETLNVIYVTDDNGLLIDDIRIREFLLTAPTTSVKNLMDRRFVALKATDDQETAVRVFKSEDRSALPVTDTAGALIGIVTVDDVLDVAEREATEDIQRLGGSEALEEPYMDIAFRKMVQKRAGWLTALFLGEMLTATAMGFFEKEIAKAVVLALFVPLIISSGGNSGSQASTLVIRALALGEVTLRDWWRVMRREIGAGLALGGILGIIGFLRITVWSAFSTIYGPHWMLVALTVSLALVGVVLWGTLVGSLLPFLLRRLGFDPATSSAPFVATLVDVTGLVIYFTVGIVVLRGTVL